MNSDHKIYEMSEAQISALKGEPIPDGSDGFDEEQVVTLREDLARLDGYLKGRADSDRAQMSRPNRPNRDLSKFGP